MKGLVLLGKRKVVIRRFPDPKPGPGEVVVRIHSAGICGSDLHFYRAEPRYLDTHLIAGHEGSGVVSEIGEGVSSLKIGDRVAIYHYTSCGHCQNCLAGEKMLCDEAKGMGWKRDGTFAEYVVIDAQNCLPLPEGLTFEDGVFLTCTGITAYSALRKLAISVGDTLAVVGLGPVGLAAILLAKAMGAYVIGLDLVPERLDLARQVGADSIVNVHKQQPDKILKDLTQGAGPKKIIETSGNPNALWMALEAVGKEGAVAVVGLGGIVGPEAETKAMIKPFSLVTKEVTLFGSRVAPIWQYYEAVSFLKSKSVHFHELITHRFSLEDAQEAFEVAATGKSGKVVFVL